MRRLRALLIRLAGVFSTSRREREMAEELGSHLEMHVEDNVRAGMSPQEARREALIKLGGLEQTKELYRDRRGLPLLETSFQDLRYGVGYWRGIGASPRLPLLRSCAASSGPLTRTNPSLESRP